MASVNIALWVIAIAPPSWAAIVFLRPPLPRMFGRQAVIPGLLCASWCAIAALVACMEPRGIIAMAPAGMFLGGFMARGHFAAWRSRKELPPGSMAFSSGVRGLAKRSFYLDGFSKWGPVFKSTQFGAPVICISGMERICRLMRSHSTHLGPSPLPFTDSIQGNFLRYMDDETHEKYGRLFRAAMADDHTMSTSHQLRTKARGLLEELAAQGSAAPEKPLRQFTRSSLDFMLFGLGADDARSIAFGGMADRFYTSSIGSAVTRADRLLMKDMIMLLRHQSQCLKRAPCHSLPVLARLSEIDPAMPDQVCFENLLFMHKIATNNVSSLLTWLLFYWSTQRESVSRIRVLGGKEKEAALDAFLSETLRLSQSEYLYRRVTRAFEFDGFYFPRGWMIRSCIWESHRNTHAFQAPSEFRIRMEPDAYAPARYAPFGMGPHACKGYDINHAISIALLSELSDGFDVNVAHGEPFMRKMRHWNHWQPNAKMKINVCRLK